MSNLNNRSPVLKFREETSATYLTIFIKTPHVSFVKAKKCNGDLNTQTLNQIPTFFPATQPIKFVEKQRCFVSNKFFRV